MGFYVEPEIPDLSGINRKWVGHFVAAMMTTQHGTYLYRVLKMNFIRLADSAIQSYEIARKLTLQYWEPSNGVQIVAYANACSYYESCITNVYRAARHMRTLLKIETPAEFSQGLPSARSFMSPEAIESLTKMRHTVQRFEQKIIQGKAISEGSPTMLVANGPEIQRGSDTVKKLDRLVLGPDHIKFSDIEQWLRDLARCAEFMTNL